MKEFILNVYRYYGELTDLLAKRWLRRENREMPIKLLVLFIFFLAVLFDVILYYFYSTDLLTVIRRFIQNTPNALY